MHKDSIGVLISGGLDSDVLLAEMAERYKKVYPIYIRQGLMWETIELYWLKKFIKKLQSPISNLVVFSLPMADVYGDHWSTGSGKVPGATSKDEAVYLPGRNMVLSLKAAVFAVSHGIKTLALGSLDHNPFPDASPHFYRQWSKTLSLGLGKSIDIIAPYRQLSKVDVIRRGKKYPLELSFSCLSPQGKFHCGCCNKCAERHLAFKVAKVEDKTIYLRHDRLNGDRFADGHRIERSKGGDSAK